MTHDEAYQEAERRIAEAQRTNATELDLSGLGLTSLPESLFQLTQLQTLYLSENHLTELPKGIGQLEDLQNLDLWINHLTELPKEIAQLKNLLTLNLWRNQLTQLPKEIAQLKNLLTLDISINPLVELPIEVIQLVQLQTLAINDIQLAKLSKKIAQLRALRVLAINQNHLTELPKQIAQLENLQLLGLNRNHLTELPKEIARLQQLRTLYLDGNRLKSLPTTLQELTELKGFYLHDNPELDIPPEILGPTSYDVFENKVKPAKPQEILEYYFRIHPPESEASCLNGKDGGAIAVAARTLNEAKVILVGEGDVGKTSLVHQLLYNEPAQPARGKTRGVDIHRWDVNIDGENIRLNVWDFGGQEIMHATHQMFMTERSVYVLVLDSRRSEEANRLDYWLRIIHSFSDGAPVIVVCNCCEQQEMDLARKQLQEKYPNIVKFVMRVCCLEESEGIDEVRDLILTQVDALHHVHSKLPGEWFSVKKEMEQWRNKKKDFISLECFRKICLKHGEKEEDKQEQLLTLLHRLGTVLHFSNGNGQQLKVLNPDWVTKGVYEILNSGALFQNHARLDGALLGEILDNTAYPKDRRRFIVDMMKEFELCWEFVDVNPWQALVPDQLRKEEPDIGMWEDALQFQFHFEVLPGSILTRFMVRKHEWIEDGLFWKHGVVLRNPNQGENNRALVRSDHDANALYISVDGDTGSRRRFLYSIRTELATIIQNIKGLKFEEKVPIPGEPDAPPVDYDYLCTLENDGTTGHYRFPGAKKLHSVSELLDGIEEPQMRKQNYERKDMGTNEEYHFYGNVHFHQDKQDRSMHDITAEQFQASTGSQNTQMMRIAIPEASDTDMHVNLEAIRSIVKMLQLAEDEKSYINRQLDMASDELQDGEPDKNIIGKALKRTVNTVKEAGKLADAVDKLKPYCIPLAHWLGNTVDTSWLG